MGKSRFRRKELDVMSVSGQNGQGLVEYALLLVMVALVVLAMLIIMGPAIGNVFSNIISAL